MTSSQTRALQNARPRFELAGESRPDMGAAVLEMQVHLPLSGMASAEVRLVNWQGSGSGSGAEFIFESVALGQSFAIAAGSGRAPVFRGEITALEERYGQGAPQLVVLAEDRLHCLARQRHNRVFESRTLGQVIERIAGEADLETDVSVGGLNADWHQLNESNLAFLQRQLAPYDIALRLQDGRLRARREEEDPEPVALSPQSNVDRLRLIADLNHQPAAARVRGFSLAEDDAAEATGDRLRPPAGGTGAADRLGDLSWAGEEIYPQPLARSQGEARAWAEGRFQQRARRFLHGDLVCRGNAGLRSGREIELSGVSPRLRGRYQVVHCRHSFNAREGYLSRIKVERSQFS